jgi:hypothetical protein
MSERTILAALATTRPNGAAEIVGKVGAKNSVSADFFAWQPFAQPKGPSKRKGEIHYQSKPSRLMRR